MFPLGVSNPPAWVFNSAAFDIDFANGRYWGGAVAQGRATSISTALSSLVSGPGNGITGAVYAPDINGVVQTFDIYTPRITNGCGLWAEGNYTNYALWCRDFTNAAWTKSNVTALKNQPSSTAAATANTCSSLTSTATDGTALQSITLSSALGVGSAYVKRLVGVGTISMTIDGGSTYTDITSQINSGTYTWVQIPNQTITNPSVGFKISTSGDSIAVDFFQYENYGYATTPLLTTNATVSRGTDEPAIGILSGGNTNDGYRLIRSLICTGGPWSVYCEATGNTAPSINTILTDWGFTLKAGTGGEPGTMKGVTGGNTATSANSGIFGLGNINKVCGRVGGQAASVCLNGGSVVTAGAGAPIYALPSNGATHAGLGNNGAAAMPLNGYMKRLAFWNRELSNGQMIEFTS